MTPATDRRLAWEACVNVRDLGGLRCGDGAIRTRRLVRGSAFGSLSDLGRAAVRAHGIRTVIDLRGDDEVAALPSPYAEGARYTRVPVSSLRMMALHESAHAGTLTEELRTVAVPGGGLADAVAAVAHAEPCVLVHCVAGRDRTGFVIATVLAAIGVPDEDVIADYVASDEELREEYVRFKAAHPDVAARVDEGVAKRAWVMAETLAAMRSGFGGAASYLAFAGVPAGHLATIRTKLTL